MEENRPTLPELQPQGANPEVPAPLDNTEPDPPVGGSSSPRSTDPFVSPRRGVQIGPAIDCDNDGKADDARMDYNGDGVPDDCVIGPG
jgi:hypothetical protein